MNETALIEKLREENEEYRKLEQEHIELEEALENLQKSKHLTPEDEIEKKRLQKQKLQGKDRMAEIIRDSK